MLRACDYVGNSPKLYICIVCVSFMYRNGVNFSKKGFAY